MSRRKPHLEIAHAGIGTREVTVSGNNPRIVAYHRSTSLDAHSASNDETPWCSSFVNWCAERSGHAGTDSAWARSWLSWCRATTSPTIGCIVVFSRGVSSGHVAFFVSKTATKIKVLGGNQGDEVNISRQPPAGISVVCVRYATFALYIQTQTKLSSTFARLNCLN